MSWLDQVSTTLRQYTGTEEEQPGPHNDFPQVAAVAPKAAGASGLAEAFRSDQTPPFAHLVSRLFRQSSSEQKAGLLNHLLSSTGPGLLGGIGGGAFPGLAALLSPGNRQITPEEAQGVSPEAVQEIAAHAEKQDPTVVESISRFYADHPTLVKTLGAAAMTIAIRKIARRDPSR